MHITSQGSGLGKQKKYIVVREALILSGGLPTQPSVPLSTNASVTRTDVVLGVRAGALNAH